MKTFNALCLVIVGIKAQATQGGVWHKLQTEILPEWKEGLGIDYTDEKMDLQKAPYIDVQNRYGGWSRISLMSAPFGNILIDRIKGFEPSYVFMWTSLRISIHQVTSKLLCSSWAEDRELKESSSTQQLATPQDPAIGCIKGFSRCLTMKTGNYNHDYHVVHVKISENEKNLPDGYYNRVMEAVSNDPIEAKRMLEGQWIDSPAGRRFIRSVLFIKTFMLWEMRKTELFLTQITLL